jgi:branched-chain amino acid transport system ATP-binding protein
MLAMARAVMLNPEVSCWTNRRWAWRRYWWKKSSASSSASEGVTMLLVEQFAAAALNVADYGYVLENGSIPSTAPESLKTDPKVIAAYLGGGH